MADRERPPAKVGTTGHEWDGIEELNSPLPRWWLWLFYATVVWSIGYWVVYATGRPLVLVGHSQGANNVIDMARSLEITEYQS
jgi:cytochrome c oxidase cbb3-type subunit III